MPNDNTLYADLVEHTVMPAFRDVQCIVATEMHVAPMPNPVRQPRLDKMAWGLGQSWACKNDQPSQYFRCPGTELRVRGLVAPLPRRVEVAQCCYDKPPSFGYSKCATRRRQDSLAWRGAAVCARDRKTGKFSRTLKESSS